jgi:hypothetical protein
MLARAMKLSAMALFCCALILPLGSCGDGGESDGSVESAVAASELKNLVTQIRRWRGESAPLIDRVEDDRLVVTQFDPPPAPLSDAQLGEVSSAGVEEGQEAKRSAEQLDQLTNLTHDEIVSLYCYFSSWYIERGLVPSDAHQFESALVGYISERVPPSASQEEVEDTVNLFRKSILNAHSEGEAAANVAMATVCSAS